MTPQYMQALATANQVRFARSRVKRDLSAGRITLADALVDPCCATMPIGELCLAQNGIGPRKVRSALAQLMVRETRPVGELTEHQREQLCAVDWPLRKRRVMA